MADAVIVVEVVVAVVEVEVEMVVDQVNGYE